MGSPNPNPVEPENTPAMVDAISGLPFPNARNVTPATSGGNFSNLENSAKLGQKKSSAVAFL